MFVVLGKRTSMLDRSKIRNVCQTMLHTFGQTLALSWYIILTDEFAHISMSVMLI